MVLIKLQLRNRREKQKINESVSSAQFKWREYFVKIKWRFVRTYPRIVFELCHFGGYRWVIYLCNMSVGKFHQHDSNRECYIQQLIAMYLSLQNSFFLCVCCSSFRIVKYDSFPLTWNGTNGRAHGFLQHKCIKWLKVLMMPYTYVSHRNDWQNVISHLIQIERHWLPCVYSVHCVAITKFNDEKKNRWKIFLVHFARNKIRKAV